MQITDKYMKQILKKSPFSIELLRTDSLQTAKLPTIQLMHHLPVKCIKCLISLITKYAPLCKKKALMFFAC